MTIAGGPHDGAAGVVVSRSQQTYMMQVQLDSGEVIEVAEEHVREQASTLIRELGS